MGLHKYDWELLSKFVGLYKAKPVYDHDKLDISPGELYDPPIGWRYEMKMYREAVKNWKVSELSEELDSLKKMIQEQAPKARLVKES